MMTEEEARETICPIYHIGKQLHAIVKIISAVKFGSKVLEEQLGYDDHCSASKCPWWQWHEGQGEWGYCGLARKE